MYTYMYLYIYVFIYIPIYMGVDLELTSLNLRANALRDAGARVLVPLLSHRLCQQDLWRKSTPPQDRQLIVDCYYSKQ